MRTKAGVAVLSVAMALSGCTTTYIVGPGPDPHLKDTLTFAQLQNRLQDRPVQVHLNDGRLLTGAASLADTDSLLLFNPRETQAIRIDQVSRILRVNHFDGAISGLSLGLFGGGFLGWGIGSLTSHGKDRGLGVGVATVEGALLGLVAGGLYGAIHGSVQVYEFPASAGPDPDP